MSYISKDKSKKNKNLNIKVEKEAHIHIQVCGSCLMTKCKHHVYSSIGDSNYFCVSIPVECFGQIFGSISVCEGGVLLLQKGVFIAYRIGHRLLLIDIELTPKNAQTNILRKVCDCRDQSDV